MNKAERFDWIENYLKAKPDYDDSVNILEQKFSDMYLDATGAEFEGMFYGAHKCKQLGKDLSEMYKAGRLERARRGINGMGGMGFPKWVYVYYLPGKP